MKSIFTEIIIPMLAALLSGGMTLIGVILTIHHENQVRREDYERSLKKNAIPLLINQGYYDNRNNEPTAHFLFTESGKREPGHPLVGVFKSTDIGVVILDRIKSKGVTYYPVNGKMNMIDKNTVTKIEITMADKKETLSDMALFVSDIFGNHYRYTMEYNPAEIKTSNLILTSLSELH